MAVYGALSTTLRCVVARMSLSRHPSDQRLKDRPPCWTRAHDESFWWRDRGRRVRFQQAAEAVQEPVFRFVRRRASREIADDVMADTLLVLWRRLDEVVDGGEVAFCLGVARRSLANYVRSSTRQLRLVGRLTASTPPGAFHAPAPDDISENPELRHALTKLPRGEREILMLWAWERLEAREIAVVLDITANAASIRLHRAK